MKNRIIALLATSFLTTAHASLVDLSCIFTENSNITYKTRGHLILNDLETNDSTQLGLESPVQSRNENVNVVLEALKGHQGNLSLYARIAVNGLSIKEIRIPLDAKEVKLEADVGNRKFAFECLKKEIETIY